MPLFGGGLMPVAAAGGSRCTFLQAGGLGALYFLGGIGGECTGDLRGQMVFAGPVAPGVLTPGIDDVGVGVTQVIGPDGCKEQLAQPDLLLGPGGRHADADGLDVRRVDRAGGGLDQTRCRVFCHPRDDGAGTHAHLQWQCGLQGQAECEGAAGRQGQRGLQLLALLVFELQQQRQRPWHGVLDVHAQALHGLPVPDAFARSQHQPAGFLRTIGNRCEGQRHEAIAVDRADIGGTGPRLFNHIG